MEEVGRVADLFSKTDRPRCMLLLLPPYEILKRKTSAGVLDNFSI